MKDKLNLFIPITKVDEERRLVYGRLTEEVPDSSGEVFDYASSKPYFEEWTGYFRKATDGKSCGNLRAMHDAKKAIGSLPEVTLNDREKAVDIVAKVIDDTEWKNVLEGVYTGFSQGGAYVKRWPDGKYTRFTAKPSEASLVDYPALKSATFQIVKSDGIVEDRAFKTKPKEVKKTMDELLNDKLAEFEKALTGMDELSKFGAKISRETMGKIQVIHDHSMALGAKCNDGAGKVDAGDMQKVTAEKDEALKKIGTLEADLKKVIDENGELKKKIAELEKEPEPSKAIKTVTKSGDNGVEPPPEPKYEKTGDLVKDEKSALELLKMAQTKPKSIAAPFDR